MPTDTFFNLPEEKRQLIIQLAMEEFAHRPYEQASITNIVKRAEIAKGSIYQYFENKKDLYFYLLETAGQAKLKFVAEQGVLAPAGDFFQSLCQQMVIGARFNLTHELETKVLTSITHSPFKGEGMGRISKLAEDYYLNLITAAQASGQVRKDIEALEIASYMLAMTNGLAEHVARLIGTDAEHLHDVENREKLNQLDLEGVIANLVELIKSGVRTSGEGER